MAGEAIYSYFIKAVDSSPIPLILYNFSRAVEGIDMGSEGSDFILRLSAHPIIIGTKFARGNTRKLGVHGVQGNGRLPVTGITGRGLRRDRWWGARSKRGGLNGNLFAEGRPDETIAAQKKLSEGD
ncbi:hypothetical protein HOY82DRAFT_477612 [Tuber indicum]|nr:hypothetical protein HOY82DRAFT_477612 [Tuber indicum]